MFGIRAVQNFLYGLRGALITRISSHAAKK